MRTPQIYTHNILKIGNYIQDKTDIANTNSIYGTQTEHTNIHTKKKKLQPQRNGHRAISQWLEHNNIQTIHK